MEEMTMAINTAFYATMNELFNRATKGVTTEVVDYNTFIDVGKQLADLQAVDLQNGFLNPLMNKIKVHIDTFRTYESAYDDMLKGNADFGTIEMVTHRFYKARYSPFVSLPEAYDDETMNPFIVSKPDISARYYTFSDAWEYALTIQETDLRGAFKDPNAMENFIKNVSGDVINSDSFSKETNRLALIAYGLNACLNNVTEAVTSDTACVKYNLLKLYNAEVGANLTADTCLHEPKFVGYCTEVIRKVGKLMRKATPLFNINGEYETFTPSAEQKLKVVSAFDSAIRLSVINAYNKEYGMLTGNYEVVPYWQNIEKPLQITNDTTEYRNEKILAFLYDNYAFGEFIDYNNTTAQYNARCEYFTHFWHGVRRYVANNDANTVVFYIADEA